MKYLIPLVRTALLAMVVLSPPSLLRANDLDVSLSLGLGFPSKGNIYNNDDEGGGSDTFIQTRTSSPWTLLGLQVNYEVFKQTSVRYWVGAGYADGLNAPSYYKFGQSTFQSTTSSTEIVNGTASYNRFQYGIGATWATGTIGEYGAFLWRRNNRFGIDGTVNTIQVQGTSLTPGSGSVAAHSSVADFMLELSMGFLQAQPDFKTFERISFGLAFGPSYGNVGATDWQLNDQYGERLLPSREIRFAFGIRL